MFKCTRGYPNPLDMNDQGSEFKVLCNKATNMSEHKIDVASVWGETKTDGWGSSIWDMDRDDKELHDVI